MFKAQYSVVSFFVYNRYLHGKEREEMNASGETADQLVRMSLQGIEVASNVVLKAGGTTAKSLAAMLYAVLTDQKKVKGKARLKSMLKSGKELKVFAMRSEDLKLFCEEAKKYGVLYSVVKEKNNKDGICDIMVRAEDAGKITRIVDKFELATIDTKAIKESILAERAHKQEAFKDVPIMSDQEHDNLVTSLMDSLSKENNKKANPLQAQPKSPVSEPISKSLKQNVGTSKEHDRKSVRAELNEIVQAKKSKAELLNKSNSHKKVKSKRIKKER